MKLSLLILFFIPLLTFSQSKSGTIKFLEEKHGFKEIVLGNDINTIGNSIKMSADSSQARIAGVDMYLVTNNDLLSVGDNIKLQSITIWTFQGKIAFIFIKGDKDYGSKLQETFIEAYGEPSGRPNRFMKKWLWITKTVTLSSDLESIYVDSFTFIDQLLLDQLSNFNKEKTKKSAKDI